MVEDDVKQRRPKVPLSLRVDFVTFILLSYFEAVYLLGLALAVRIDRQNYTACLQAWFLSIISMPGTG